MFKRTKIRDKKSQTVFRMAFFTCYRIFGGWMKSIQPLINTQELLFVTHFLNFFWLKVDFPHEMHCRAYESIIFSHEIS